MNRCAGLMMLQQRKDSLNNRDAKFQLQFEYRIHSIATGETTMTAGLDLNLLPVLVALDESGTVSGAAERLERSQPAISIALGRLREFFNDPLFIRSGNAMVPTPRGKALAATARTVLDQVGRDMVTQPTFEPGESTTQVTIALSEGCAALLLPRLVAAFRTQMPAGRLRTIGLSMESASTGLADGSVDLAIGYGLDLQKHNFFQQVLLVEPVVAVVAGRRAENDTCTLEDYLAADHLIIDVEPAGTEGKDIERIRARRRITLTAGHLTSLQSLVHAGAIAALPLSIAEHVAATHSDLSIVGMPFAARAVSMRQAWHRRFHHDARSRWLRRLVWRLLHPRSIELPAWREASVYHGPPGCAAARSPNVRPWSESAVQPLPESRHE